MNKKSKLYKLSVFVILSIIISLIITPIVFPIILTLQTADTENLEDTYATSGEVGIDSSASTSMWIGSGTGSPPFSTTFIKFTLPTNVNSYNSAILSLYFWDADGSGAFSGNSIISILNISNQTWIESTCQTLDSINKCPSVNNVIESFVSTTRIPDNNPRWVNFTVTSQVNAYAKQNVSFAINNTLPVNGAVYKFYSKEYTTDTSLRPKLILSYTLPGVNIIYPLNTSYNINVSTLNYTYSDASNCWYSNSSGIWNSSIVSAGTNFTNVISKEGSNTWTLYCNDSVNNLNSTSVTFFKDTINPQINIIFPINNSNFSYSNVNINYTRSDTNLGQCKWTNNSGVTNTTISDCSNLTTYNWAEGLSTVIIYVNDSAGNVNSSQVTFTTDTIKPTITIFSPTNTTYKDQYSYNLSLNVSATDSGLGVNSSTWKWTINNGVANTTFTPNTTLTGLSAGSNTLKVYVKDNVGNENQTNVTFYLSFTPRINYTTISNGTTNYSTTKQTLLNPSFENWTGNVPDNWNVSGNRSDGSSNITQMTNDPVDGTSYLRLKGNYTYFPAVTSSVITLEPAALGGVYQLSGYIRTNRTTYGYPTYGFSTTNHNFNSDLSVYTSWTRIERYFQLGTDTAANLQAKCGSYNLNGTVDCDNFELIRVYPIYNENNSDIPSMDMYESTSGNVYTFNDTGATSNSRSKLSTFNGTLGWNTDRWTWGNSATQVFNFSSRGNSANNMTNASFTYYLTYYPTAGARIMIDVSKDNINWQNNSNYTNSSGINYYTYTVPSDFFPSNNLYIRIRSTSVNSSYQTKWYKLIANWTNTLDTTNGFTWINPTFQEYANVTINATIVDEDTSSGSLYYSWFVDGVSVLTGFTQNVLNWIFTSRSSSVNLLVNDTNNYQVNQSWNISTTFINPTISFTGQTPTNNSNQSSTSVTINITGTEMNINSSWVNLNGTNYTMSCNGTNPYYCNKTISGLADGVYNFTAYINDSVGNLNNTEKRFFRVDTTPPVTNAYGTSPPGGASYTFNTWTKNNVEVTTIVTESGVGYNDAIYPVYCKDTTDTCTPNTWIGPGVTVSTENVSYIRYYSNDTLNNKETTKSQIIKIDTIAPSINITNPISYQNFSSNLSIALNYSVSDSGSGVANCSYKLNSGNNISITNCQNITFNISEGLNNITLYVNDSVGNLNSSTVIFRVDMNPPLVTILIPGNITYRDEYDYNLTLNVSANDSGIGIISSYWYSLNNAANVTFTPNITLPGLIAGGNIIKVWANDSLGNINSTNVSFYLAFTPKINEINISNSSNSYSRNNLTDGLVLWLKLDENNTIQRDSSGNGWNGTTNLSIYSDSGKIGGGFYANGTSIATYINLNGSLMRGLVNHTFVTWFKSENINNRFIISGAESGPNNNDYLIGFSNASTVYFGYNSSTYLFSSNKLYNDSQWHLLIISKDGNNLSTYIDNQFIQNYTTTHNAINVADLGLYIGQEQDVVGGNFALEQSWNGSLDEIRFYNRSLTPSEIQYLYYITNPTFQEYANVTINATITDEDSSLFTYEWFVDYVSVVVSTTQNFLNWIFTKTSTIVTLKVNDSSGYEVNQTWNISTTFINPQIDYGIGTAVNYANLSQDYIYVNTTWTETNFANITFTLRNDSGDVNITTFTSPTYTINWANLPNKNYTYFVNITDLTNNKNSTPIYTITLDTTYPNATLLNPINNSNNNTDQNFTANFTDNLGIKNATLHIFNSTDSEINTTTFDFATNIIQQVVGVMVALTDGVYTWFYDLFDWAGNTFTTNNYTITIDKTIPLINITFPINNSNQSINTLNINYTRSDTNLDSCWYSNDTYAINTTLANCNNLTNIIWSEGNHNVTIWINDSAGNVNSSRVTFWIDTIAPSLSIAFPQDSYTYDITVLSLNYTVSDSGLGLDSCWYKNNTGNNITIANCQNTTISQPSDGTYTIYLWANDTVGNTAITSSTYTVSTSAPAVSLVRPLNNSYLNSSSVTFNYTAVDSNGVNICELWGNFTGTWAKNKTNNHNGDTNVNASEGNFTVNIGDGNYIWNVWCNDTTNVGNFTINNFTLSVDTINPLISFGTGTAANNTNTTNTYIYVNISITEINPSNITFLLFNSTGQVNSTTFSMINQTSNNTINWTNLVDGVYTYNATIRDKANNKNITDTYLIRLDDTPPNLIMTQPQAINYANNNSIPLNFSVSDNLIGIKTCQYYVLNSSDSIIIPPTTITNCQNTTFSLPGGDIDYNLTLKSFDNLNNFNTSTVNFGVRTNSPAIVLGMNNNTFKNNLTSHIFNFTVSTATSGISTCELWGNFTGTWEKNQTKTSISTSLTNNFTSIDLSEGTFQWNVWCNDSLNNSGFAFNNYTYTTDITYPIVNITSVSGTAGSQTITTNYTYTELYPSSCYYNIVNSSGGYDVSNTTISSCSSSFAATVTLPASSSPSFNLTVYVQDSAGNINSSIYSFQLTPLGVTAGGGGSTTVKVVNQTVFVNRTFCGDGVCQNPEYGFPHGNDLNISEYFHNCPQDCEGADVDTILFGCLDNDPSTQCIWLTLTFQYIALFGLLFMFIIGVSTIEDKQTGKQINTAKYYYLRATGRKKKRLINRKLYK